MKQKLTILIINLIAGMLFPLEAKAQSFYWVPDDHIESVEVIIDSKEEGEKQVPKENDNLSINEQYPDVVKTAMKYIGVPYVWGGVGPSGFDCSGLIQYVYQQNGKYLPRVTTQQERCGQVIPISQAQAGDLYFWGSQGRSYHVALACGNGKFIQAPAPGQSVMISDVDLFRPSFAVHLQ